VGNAIKFTDTGGMRHGEGKWTVTLPSA